MQCVIYLLLLYLGVNSWHRWSQSGLELYGHGLGISVLFKSLPFTRSSQLDDNHKQITPV